MVKTVLVGGVIAGTIDILDAFAVTALNGGSPVRVLYAIASGVLGRTASSGGMPAAALGLALHFFIALTAALVFAVACRRVPRILRHPVICGLVYGLMVWGVMYYVVLPITFGRPNTLPAWPLLI